MPTNEPKEGDPDMEELTLSEVAKEFRIKRSTINNYVWRGRLPARKEFTELGVPYYLVKRGDVSRLLASLPKNVRKPHRGT